MRLIFAFCVLNLLVACFGGQQKPAEPGPISRPESASGPVSWKTAIIVRILPTGNVTLTFGDMTRKEEILNSLNTERALDLNADEIAKLKKMPTIGLPLRKLKQMLALAESAPDTMKVGIPTADSNHNELTYWMKAIRDAYKGDEINEINLIVMGANYPAFKNVTAALKKNDIFKFKILEPVNKPGYQQPAPEF